MKTVAFIRTTDIYSDSRALKEIKALAEAGYRVIILGWNRGGAADDGCKRVFGEYGDLVQWRLYPCVCGYGLGMRKNIGKMLGWFRWVYSSLKTCPPLDVVHACDLDAGIPAYRFCKKNKIKLVYDVFDYYVDAHDLPNVLRRWVENQEISIINFAEATLICTEERRVQIAKASPKEVAVLHNSPEVPEIEETAEKIDYAYCGQFIGMRLISEMFDLYEKNSDLKLTFAGAGVYAERARSLSEQHDNFSYLGSIPYTEVLKLESQARVLAAIYAPSLRNHQLCAPNKFYEGLALAKPLIVCRGTGIDRIVEENNIGIVIDYSAESFYEALRTLCADEKLRHEMGVRARRLYEEKYNWQIMKERLLAIYENRIFGSVSEQA